MVFLWFPTTVDDSRFVRGTHEALGPSCASPNTFAADLAESDPPRDHGKQESRHENHGKTMGKPWENHGKMIV